jgi:2'-5' RNA ligase
MRIFTAIELTEAARAAVLAERTRVVAALPKGGGRLSLVRPEHLHLTLVFVGEVSPERAAAIARVMTDDLPIAPFQLTLSGVGAFPPRGAPRVLFLDTAAGRVEAIELYRLTADRLAGEGVDRDRRPYHAHVTLGRWRDSRPSDRPRTRGDAPVATIEVREVVLFESRLSSSGPSYTRLTAARLNP